MLERLLRSGTFARVAQRAFIGNLKQVTRFLTDRSAKELVLERVDEEVDSSVAAHPAARPGTRGYRVRARLTVAGEPRLRSG